MENEAKIALTIIGVLIALILITNGGGNDIPDDYYPEDMNSCIYTGVGGWDC